MPKMLAIQMNSSESCLKLSVHLYHKASAMLVPRKDENLSRVRCVAPVMDLSSF